MLNETLVARLCGFLKEAFKKEDECAWSLYHFPRCKGRDKLSFAEKQCTWFSCSKHILDSAAMWRLV